MNSFINTAINIINMAENSREEQRECINKLALAKLATTVACTAASAAICTAEVKKAKEENRDTNLYVTTVIPAALAVVGNYTYSQIAISIGE